MLSGGASGSDSPGIETWPWEHQIIDLAFESALPKRGSDDPDFAAVVRLGRFVVHDCCDLPRAGVVVCDKECAKNLDMKSIADCAKACDKA